MRQEWWFTFRQNRAVPTQSPSMESQETALMKQLSEGYGSPEDVQWNLARLYGTSGMPVKACAYTEAVLAVAKHPARKAACLLTLGQLHEQIGDYTSALEYYLRLIDSDLPVADDILYLAENNAAYCLNQFGRFQEAEGHCREAIAIDPGRHNAHKNLGVALEGQLRHMESVHCYVLAVRRNATDARAFRHLQDLTQGHPELFDQIADLDHLIQQCSKAVTFARLSNEARQ